MERIIKFGRNADIGTSIEDIWEQGGNWVAPTAARVHNIVSGSTNDASPSGSGARTIHVEGLDSNGVEIHEDVTMNGDNNVATTKSYTFVSRLKVLTAGSGGENAGAIKATALTDGTVSCSMRIGDNQSTLAVYKIPADKRGWILHFDGSLLDTANNRTAVVGLWVMEDGTSVWNLKHLVGIENRGNTTGTHIFRAPFELAPLSTIKLTGKASAASMDVFGSFDLILTHTDDEPYYVN